MSDREIIEVLASEIRGMRLEILEMKSIIKNQVIENQWMSLKEACIYLGIGKTKMHQLLSTGEIPWAVKNGKSWRFPADKLKLYAGGRLVS